MLPSRFLAQAAISLVLLSRAYAETHVIKFVNQCGFGTPALMYNGKNILTGDTYTSDGPFSGIAYLQTGYCNINGENCTLMEMTLINPTCDDGCGSSADLSLIYPHKYSVETSFSYYDGCDGQGKTCSNSDCTNAAFFQSNDNFVQVACQVNNVNLLIAFCAEAGQFISNVGTTPSGTSPTSSPTPSSTYLPPPETTNKSSVLPTAPSSLPPVRPVSTGTPSSAPSGTPPPVSTPTPTPTPTPTDTDTGCDDEPTTPLTPIPTETDPGCGEDPTTPPITPPTFTPTGTGSDPCDEPTPSGTPLPPPFTPSAGSGLPSLPPPASGSLTPLPTPSRRCRPRPTGFTPSGVPTSPATPTSRGPYIPLTTSGSAPDPAPTGTPDPCDDEDVPTPSAPAPQRRRHRRMSRMRY